MTGLIWLMAAAWLLSLAYLAVIHRLARRERAARRKGADARIAVRIWPPRDTPAASLHEELGLFRRAVLGVVADQPRALPLLAAIIGGGGVVLLLIDPLMDAPLLWPAGTASGWPGWLRFGWLSGVMAAVLWHVWWIFDAAPAVLSHDRIVLHRDGRITAEGAAMPSLDPARPFVSVAGIEMSGPRAPGVTISQGGEKLAFDTMPHPVRWYQSRHPARLPLDWWHVAIGPEAGRLEAFLHRHYPPAA